MDTRDLFSVHRSPKRLNESLQKVFGKKINLENFSLEQLEDARNKLRTQISQARSNSNFNETVENDAFHQAKFMLDAIVAEIADREEFIADAGTAEASYEEGAMKGVDYDLQQLALDGDEEKLIDAMEGLHGTEIQIALEDMMSNLADELAAKGMDDVINDQDKMIEILMDRIVDEYGGENMEDVREGKDDQMRSVLKRVADQEDFNKLDDLIGSRGPIGSYLRDEINDITAETGMHYKDDYDRITSALMFRLQDEFGGEGDYDDEGGETDDDYALKSAGFGSDEDYGDFGRDESVQGDDMRRVTEGEIQQAQSIVSAKTMVDRVGRWIEELSGMENDSLLQLGDQIRDEMGQEQAKAFIEAVAPAIQQALENLKTTRETLATGVRILTGEEQPAQMLGGEPGAEGEGMPAAEPDAMNLEPEEGDEFAAAEPAVGGGEAAGREQRESIQFQNRLFKILAG